MGEVHWCSTVGHGGITATEEVEGDPYCHDCAAGFAADREEQAEGTRGVGEHDDSAYRLALDDGPSPTDAEFDAAIDAAYAALHAFRSSVYGVERSRAAQELADALADLLALCGRTTIHKYGAQAVRMHASDVLCMALSPAGFICNREPAHDGDHVALALNLFTDDPEKVEVARWPSGGTDG